MSPGGSTSNFFAPTSPLSPTFPPPPLSPPPAPFRAYRESLQQWLRTLSPDVRPTARLAAARHLHPDLPLAYLLPHILPDDMSQIAAALSPGLHPPLPPAEQIRDPFLRRCRMRADRIAQKTQPDDEDGGGARGEEERPRVGGEGRGRVERGRGRVERGGTGHPRVATPPPHGGYGGGDANAGVQLRDGGEIAIDQAGEDAVARSRGADVDGGEADREENGYGSARLTEERVSTSHITPRPT